MDLLTMLSTMQDFLRASRSQSQEGILKTFLKRVIHTGHFCEAGSILIDYPEDRKLRLFNPDHFVTKEGYLKQGEPWQGEFDYGQGIAGEAFRLRQTVVVADAKGDRRFSTVEGQVPISSMICAPIILDDRRAPFGVASFHNSSPTQVFGKDSEYVAETYVSVLGLALAGASEKLDRRLASQRRVFIGCASEDLDDARIIQSLLREAALVRIWNQGVFKSGGYVLETLLRVVKEYDCAIFLLSPNDLIQHRGERYLVARDNVLFEAGLFFSQLGRERTFLIVPKVADLKLPSDLDGLIKLYYVPPQRSSDMEPSLAPVCTDIMDFLRNPLPPRV
jgi:predicted nucleotide-binding protein